MNEKSRKGVNSSNILNGVIIMILSAFIFFYTGAGLIFLIYVFTFIILLSGISRIYVSINNENLSKAGKVTKFISGFLLLLISFVVFITTLGDPFFSTNLLIFFITIGLFIIGIARIGTGMVNKKFQKWFRIFLVIVGGTTIILNFILMIFANIDMLIVIYLIAVSLFLNGFTRFLYGLTGTEKFRKN